MKLFKLLVPALVLSLLIIGCGGGPSAMSLSPTTVKLEQKDATATLVAQFQDAKGASAEFKGTVAWMTSDADVATVANGVVTAVNSGKATITATAGEMTATATVTVQIPYAIKVTPSSLTLKVDDSGDLKATIFDTAGAPITGKEITWSTGNSKVATVGNKGKVKALSEGDTVVTASYAGFADKATVTVGAEKKEPVKAEDLKLKKKEKKEKKPAVKPGKLKKKKK